jgi:hypothetical protein
MRQIFDVIHHFIIFAFGIILIWTFSVLCLPVIILLDLKINKESCFKILEAKNIGQADPSLNGQQDLYLSEKGIPRFVVIYFFLYSFNLFRQMYPSMFWYFPSFLFFSFFYFKLSKNFTNLK